MLGVSGRTGRRRRWNWVAVAVLVTAATACEPVMPEGIGTPVADPMPESYPASYLTTERNDRYDWTGGSGTMAVSAPSTNTGGNTRGVFVPAGIPATRDHESCASWQGGHGRIIQQGVALRVRDESGGTRAITVTKNIYYGATWIFNVHTWEPGGVFRPVGSRDFSAVMAPEPWHLCARVVGDKVEVKLWTGADPVPAWGDKHHTGVVQLPRGWVYAGRPGGYAGHLEQGDMIRYTNLATSTYP
jgi:hypothetical protein